MNKSNNKKRKNSEQKIKRAFMELLQTNEINRIAVSDICKLTNLNRSTFYNNYLDIYDLADKIKEELFQEVLSLYSKEANLKIHSYDFLKLLNHIRDNQLFYKTYFKLDYNDSDINLFEKLIDYDEFRKYYEDDKYIKYHITFFKYGFNAVIRKWLYCGCIESPEEIKNIIINEYRTKR